MYLFSHWTRHQQTAKQEGPFLRELGERRLLGTPQGKQLYPGAISEGQSKDEQTGLGARPPNADDRIKQGLS